VRRSKGAAKLCFIFHEKSAVEFACRRHGSAPDCFSVSLHGCCGSVGSPCQVGLTRVMCGRSHLTSLRARQAVTQTNLLT
jgi:hypothetical protein